MRPALKPVPMAGILLLGGLMSLVFLSRADGEDEPAPTKSARGGFLGKTERHQFEVFFYTQGIRIFPQDSTGKGLDATNLTAIATFYHPNSPSPWFDRRLQPATAAAGQPSTSLVRAIGLGTVPASGAKVVFEISGLPDPTETSVSFTVPFALMTSQVPAPVATDGTASPRFIYAAGSQGVGYYANPGPQSAPPSATGPRPAAPPRYTGSATRTQASGSSGPRTVGPGARDWTTGRRSRLPKPWLRPMD
ncbi:hypothetical protein SAMN05444166_7851 [Singulisphaera sp. GP187]|uniref:hypothetical protein n=1 Tax=Singulisphaera sp. GP187 TaxID=1882752 RepID=UPI000928D917|nr:hypothetical protein [Singulisphaera sp. GP187]SIO65827.1 hypothetical protein SAMN05444166_7851 [Singulisphaera sp. GP187]